LHQEKCFLIQVDEIWLWHRRLGHLSFDNLIKDNEKKAVRDLPKVTSSNVYILNIDEEEKCFLIQVDEIWLWHRRLGHLSFENLIKDNEKKAVRDLPKVIKPSDSICKHCQIENQTRVRLKKKRIPQQNH
jgi:hypothetical protein